MWNKIYAGVLAASVLVIAVLSYLAHGWLQSIGSPVIAMENYNYFAHLGSLFLWISTLVLLVIGNVVLWTTKRSWTLWATFVYFAAAVILQTFWLDRAFFQFRQESQRASGEIFWSPVFGATLIILLAIIVFFNQFIVKRLLDKMHPPAPIETVSTDENSA